MKSLSQKLWDFLAPLEALGSVDEEYRPVSGDPYTSSECPKTSSEEGSETKAKKAGESVARSIEDITGMHVSQFLKQAPLERTCFIRNVCMIKQVEADALPSIINLEDHITKRGKSVFCARARYLPPVPAQIAERLGFLLPFNALQYPHTVVTPLMIHCFGVGSGSVLHQIGEAVMNGIGMHTELVDTAVVLVKSFIDQERAKYPHLCIVPYLTGHSLGGMFALALALKLRIGSCVFNPWGMGKKVCEYVGLEAFQTACGEDKMKHLVFRAAFDFTSSPASPLRWLVRIPGHVIRMELSDGFAHPYDNHVEYRDYFDRHIAKCQAQ